jgi:hypothetical protein
MGSLMEELRRREAAARAGADRLRSRIEELAEELARAEEQVSRLVIAREEVTRLLEGPAVADPPAGQQAGGFAGEPRQASPAGAVTVPPWQDGAEASALPRAYQDLLEVAADAGCPEACSHCRITQGKQGNPDGNGFFFLGSKVLFHPTSRKKNPSWQRTAQYLLMIRSPRRRPCSTGWPPSSPARPRPA